MEQFEATQTDNFTKSIESAGFIVVGRRMFQNLVLRMSVILSGQVM